MLRLKVWALLPGFFVCLLFETGFRYVALAVLVSLCSPGCSHRDLAASDYSMLVCAPKPGIVTENVTGVAVDSLDILRTVKGFPLYILLSFPE